MNSTAYKGAWHLRLAGIAALCLMTVGCGSDRTFAELPAEEAREAPEIEIVTNPDGTAEVPGFAGLGLGLEVPFRVTSMFEASQDVTAAVGPDQSVALLETQGTAPPFWTGNASEISRWDRKAPGDPWVVNEEYIRFGENGVHTASERVHPLSGGLGIISKIGSTTLVHWSDLTEVETYDNATVVESNYRSLVLENGDGSLLIRSLLTDEEVSVSLPEWSGSREYAWNGVETLLVQFHDGFAPEATREIEASSGTTTEIELPGVLNSSLVPGGFENVYVIVNDTKITHLYQNGELTPVGECSPYIEYDGGFYAYLDCGDQTHQIVAATGDLLDTFPGMFIQAWGGQVLTAVDLRVNSEKSPVTWSATYHLSDEYGSWSMELEHPADAVFDPWRLGLLVRSPESTLIAYMSSQRAETVEHLCVAGFDRRNETVFFVEPDRNNARVVWRDLGGGTTASDVRAPNDCNVFGDHESAMILGQDNRVRVYNRDGSGELLAENAGSLGRFSRVVESDDEIGVGSWPGILKITTSEPGFLLYDLRLHELTKLDVAPGETGTDGLAIGLWSRSPEGLLFGFQSTRPSEFRVISTDRTAEAMGRWNPWLVTHDEASGTSTVRRVLEP